MGKMQLRLWIGYPMNRVSGISYQWGAEVFFLNKCTVAKMPQGKNSMDNRQFFFFQKSKKSYNFFGISGREALENARKE